MKRTTGADSTALSIAAFVSLDRKRACKGVRRHGEAAHRRPGRKDDLNNYTEG